MLKKTINFFISRIKRKKNYPYKYTILIPEISKSKINYLINNPIEEFRIVNWGSEKEYVLDMISDLKLDDIFLDIGSSVGLISILAAFKAINGKVISIEPDPENYKCLNENYNINNLSNYKTFQLAAGDVKTTMKLFSNGSNGFSPSLKKVNGIDSFLNVSVEKIDDLINDGVIDYPTIIKIDIEGAELIALNGMRTLLMSENRPRILFIEIHPEFLIQFNSNLDDFFDFFKDLKYKIVHKIDRHEQILCKLESI